MLARHLPTLTNPSIEQEASRVEGYAVERKIALGPKVLFYFADACEKGFSGDLSSFVNSVIDSYYRARGVSIALTEQKVF